MQNRGVPLMPSTFCGARNSGGIMFNLTIVNGDDTVTVPTGKNTRVMDVLPSVLGELSFPCGGKGVCGKCRIRAEGAVSPPTESEKALLGEDLGETRLACFTYLTGDASVTLQGHEAGNRIALRYAAEDFPLKPLYKSGYGAAVDIGTTTVVGYLFSKDSTRPIAQEGAMNRQRVYGADVLSRIDYSNHYGVQTLTGVIRAQINDMLVALCRQAQIQLNELTTVVVAGNTTMLHFAAGLDPKTLALAPFTPLSLFGNRCNLALADFPGLAAHLTPCISSYVGGDIVCAILASSLLSKSGTTLLVDVGTNGEMALCRKKELICCSTAAGPAFEGAGISTGMCAQRGAISKVWIADGEMRYATIENAPPVGICGSGLIDAVHAMLRLGYIDKSGRIEKRFAGQVLIGDSTVAITQPDVRELQLAKAAIRAGIDTMLEICDLQYGDVNELILCGGFGSYLNPDSAAGIGLIPAGVSKRTNAIGNAAGAGAGRMLQSRKSFNRATMIADEARTVELSGSPRFNKRFVAAMSFDNT